MHGNIIIVYLFYIITKQTTRDKPFLFQNILTYAKAHFGEHEKKLFGVIYDIQNEAISLVTVRSKEL